LFAGRSDRYRIRGERADLMDVRYDIVMDTPAGRLGIRLQEERVLAIHYVTRRTRLGTPASPAARQVAEVLADWFRDAASPLDIPVKLCGTAFQRRVWAALRRIPRGEVRTYGELADQLGSGARAVGNACRHNPVPILVPCHRVVAASGPGGYGGHTGGALLQRKLWLLRHEGAAAALKSA
jgi:methylated-DNA-[protein]-cysteine S-methyltransferase